MTPIRERLQAALGDALRSRDTLRTSVLRTTLSAIANAEAVDVPPGTTSSEVPRRHLTEDDMRAVVTSELVELETIADEVRARDRTDAALQLEQKAAVLADLLRP